MAYKNLMKLRARIRLCKDTPFKDRRDFMRVSVQYDAEKKICAIYFLIKQTCVCTRDYPISFAN